MLEITVAWKTLSSEKWFDGKSWGPKIFFAYIIEQKPIVESNIMFFVCEL